jgi:CHAD domain-containing protein
MKVDIDKAMRPARRLRKLLKEIPSELMPEYVHKIRTQARKLEATAHAISFVHDRRASRLLKKVEPLRKAAGKVRDMDVMIDKVLSMAEGIEVDGRDALLRLTEQMAAVREKSAEGLRRLLRDEGKPLRRKLQGYARRMKKAEPDEVAESMAAPQILTVQLQHWPRLKAENLHEFRIHAKELRYMLQLAPEANEHMVQAFGRVKDVAGEWHDWLQLREYAGKVLDDKADHAVLRRLREMEHAKLRAALAAANAVRHNGLAG